ncbi:mite allergen Lep d 7-like [Oppia nitens]|uniref:mite allergen Lep d 7-like n=1 Tax=Oppia nitens TaxID=1686743 RepID=UPI0023DB7600|nr:mite allergen Lep d 7-like [Oppia nitens]XP_054157978.1 mite allergen Lep d 7-like [Oppia nitens]
MMVKSFIILMVTTLLMVDCHEYEFNTPGNANQMVDQLLTVVKAKYNTTLDPFHVPNMNFNFTKKIALSTWHGEANLTEGTIKGLGAIKRSGDCDIGTDKGHFIGHLQFGDNNIHAHFHAVTQIGIKGLKPIHSTINLDADIGNIDVKITVGMNEKGKLQLKEFQVDELKHVKFHVKGLKILDPLVNVMADAFVAIFNPQARQILGNILKNIIGKEIENLKFPPAV